MASTYGDRVIECTLNVKSPIFWDAGGREYSQTSGLVDSLSHALAEAKRTGLNQVVYRSWGRWDVPSHADCIIIKNIVDPLDEGFGIDGEEAYLEWLERWVGDVYIVADPSKINSD